MICLSDAGKTSPVVKIIIAKLTISYGREEQ